VDVLCELSLQLFVLGCGEFVLGTEEIYKVGLQYVCCHYVEIRSRGAGRERYAERT
jgi:hypothetical protein